MLKQQLLTTTMSGMSQVDTSASTAVSQRDQIRNEIEIILAADCLYCGELMIDNIDKPFINDWNKVNLDWQ